MNQILNGREIFKDRSNASFQALRFYKPGLMVDIGAATGYTAAMMIRFSPESKVLAFEPFPGNHKFFNDFIDGDPRVTLDTRAVSDGEGEVTFVIPDVLNGSQKGWEDFVGYSSLGGIGLRESEKSTSIQVKTCSIDEVVDEPIRFLKIDVQGAEMKVLRGCQRLIDEDKIDIMFVEYDGRDDVMEFIIDNDFVVIDSECVLVLQKGVKPSEWDIIRESSLSTGKVTSVGWPKKHISDPFEYSRFLREQRKVLGAVWTDLVCVSRSALPSFMFAAGKRDQQVPEDYKVSMREKISKPLEFE